MNLKKFKNLYFSVIAIILIFIVLELLAKSLLTLLNKPTVAFSIENQILKYDFLLGYSKSPLLEGNYEIKTKYHKTDRYGFSVDGDRSQEKDLTQKEKCEYRIFMLGGSTVESDNPKNRYDTIPAKLSSKLKNLNKNIYFQVINAGETGFFSNQELLLLQNRILYALKPDQIIIFNGSNDFIVPIGKEIYLSNSNDYQRYFQDQIIKQNDNVFLILDDFLSKNLTIYYLPKKILEKTINIIFPHKENVIVKEYSNKEYNKQKVKRYFYNINILKKLSSKETNINIFFQPQILKESLNNLLDQEKKIYQKQNKLYPEYFSNKEIFYNMIRKKIKGNYIKPSDFFKMYDISTILDYNESNLPFYSDHVHYTELAKEIIAERIFLEIKDDLIKKTTTSYNHCF